MTFLLVRSIPLSKETRDAWRTAGVRTIKRADLSTRNIPKAISRLGGRGIINLGNLDIDFSGCNINIFNHPDSIRAVSSPVALRRTLSDFLPEATRSGPHWHKQGGFGGRGKAFHENLLGECASFGGDVQAHVDGEEFRVNTVGGVVVQAHKKTPGKNVGDFTWDWCGVKGIAKTGIIPLIKDAVPSIPKFERTVFGWDIIVGSDGPKIIEINTSAGVNEPTAQRIVNQLERIL